MAKPFSLCNAFAAFFLFAALLALAPPASAAPVVTENQDTQPVPVPSPTLVPYSNVSPPSLVCSNAGCEESDNKPPKHLSADELQLQMVLNTRIEEFIHAYFTAMLAVVYWALVDVLHPGNDDVVWREKLSQASSCGTVVFRAIKQFLQGKFVKIEPIPVPSVPFTPHMVITYLNEVVVKPICDASQLELSRVNLCDEQANYNMWIIINSVGNLVHFVVKDLTYSEKFRKFAPSVRKLQKALMRCLSRHDDPRDLTPVFTEIHGFLANAPPFPTDSDTPFTVFERANQLHTTVFDPATKSQE